MSHSLLLIDVAIEVMKYMEGLIISTLPCSASCHLAAKHATWSYNEVENKVMGLTPLALLTKTHSDHCGLFRTHVWRCPTFMLNLKLQNGQKLSK